MWKDGGHNFKKIESVFAKFEKIKNKPKFLIADTIKGKGVNLWSILK